MEKKKLEDTEGNLASGDNEEQDEDTEDEDMEEQRGKAREPPVGSVLRTEEAPQEGKESPVQFLDRDEEEEDGPDADFLTVKRRDVFGLELKENEPLSVSLLQMESSLCANCILWKVMKSNN
ncbi:putative ATP-dependent RNA helicase DDX10 [Sigmodon hispidus]